MPDAHANFAISSVLVPPSPATTGTSLQVAAGQQGRFPAAPFNATVWPAGQTPDPTSAEIVRVTNIAGNVLTITRSQESSTARAIVFGDQFAATITAKTITDIEAMVTAGPTGPTGPIGPTGATGPAGNAGPNALLVMGV